MQGYSSKAQQTKRSKAKRKQAQARYKAKLIRYAISNKTWLNRIAGNAPSKLYFVNTPKPKPTPKPKLSVPYKHLQQVLLGYTHQVWAIGTQRYTTTQATLVAYVLPHQNIPNVLCCYVAPTNNRTGYIVSVSTQPQTGTPHTTQQFWLLQYL